ncbi:recombination regulator RecX [Streptomyces alkaliterrae]|uniref:Regulatory protein RecX n=1 Tax=Streptomyces alkaliterrae TaxID=2213162 RepID=A0A5P0YKD5_9ACTN|nr:recombination regulator RecX [Streptomyces alkaliterrae]MBB1252585.1 recombination regulator RecX [Streptomyces alkaliterrae]MBB1258589.1 recombination regulator RecX [Streptomyces alkaliterrae]MQS00834.1 recombination regulator RecX [Streptomyces alkaliterrae]
MTRRTGWPTSGAAAEDGGGLDPSRAGEGPPHHRGKRRGGSAAPAEDAAVDPVERARAICLRLLTGTPRTRQQLAEALRKREVPQEAAEEVLSRLEAVGLIDDSAFAQAWVDSRHHSRGLAGRALARELRSKGVESEVVEEAVGRLDAEQEEQTARELVERRLPATRGLATEKRLRRLVGMLARKGYPQGLAVRVVREALAAEGEAADLLEEHLPEG